MRYLIFGDIHGNLPVLDAVFKVEKGNYDRIICHGDVVGYGPWINDCVLYLNEFSNIILLKGNHEDAFLAEKYSGSNIIAKKFFDFCLPQFKHANLINNYHPFIDIGNYIVKHTISNMYIFSDTDLNSIRINRNYIIGHSHQQFFRFHNQFEIINTGSLGQNRKYINSAEYIIYDEKSNKVFLKSFSFDIDLTINEMESRMYPVECINYYKFKKRI